MKRRTERMSRIFRTCPYADQNQRDYDTFVKVIAGGHIQALTGV